PHSQEFQIYESVLAPLCSRCQSLGAELFDLQCSGCSQQLEVATPNQLFALIRQWTRPAQQLLPEIVDRLAELGVGPNDRDQVTDFAQLHFAAKCGALASPSAAANAMRGLLLAGAQPEARSRWTDVTPLHLATMFNCQEAVEVLLEAGADPLARCTEFEDATPLHLAAAHLSEGSARLLVSSAGQAALAATDELLRRPVDCLPQLTSGLFNIGRACYRAFPKPFLIQ
ncbi:hypothetical protein BOX15_Mlig016211g1, partial [Macrostomum lignano]